MTTLPPSNRPRVLAMLGVFALALVGVGFLVLAVFLLVRGPGASAGPASPTRISVAATQAVFVPTTTQGPPTATLAPTEASTPTAPPAVSDTPAASATTARVVTISKPANVRTGPGLTYSVIGGLNVGQTAPVVGRDSSAQWFAISYDGAPQGTGWVSTQVATYDGSVNDLPVVQASAPPPPTAAPGVGGGGGGATSTAPPAPAASNTPSVSGSGGIQTLLFQMHQTTGHPGDKIFFDFTVVNTTGTDITYGILAAHTDVGVTADSWHDPLKAGKTLNWTDHIDFPNAGTYQVYLGICYASHDACKTGGAPWTKLSASTTVTIN
jgi:hypothetical protein